MKTRALRRYVVAFGIIAAMSLLGCATFRDDNRTPIPTWPLQSSERKPSINLNVKAKAWVNKTEIPADRVQSNFLGEWRSQASKAFEESSLFSEVKLSSDDITDMQADKDIERRVEYSETLAFITGFTFGLSSVLIPQKETTTFAVTSTFKDKDGHVMGTFKQSESVAMWVQFFLLFGMPFMDSPGTTMTAAMYDVHRAIIQDIHQKKMLADANKDPVVSQTRSDSTATP